MHPRTAELADLLARERAALLAAVDAVPADRRDVAPSPGTWSVAEVLGHLVAVEGGSARLLARRLERAREGGLAPERETTSVLGRLPRALLLDGPAREAPEITRPAAGVGADEALAGLERSRAALLAVLHDGDGLALGEVRATHAVFGEIDLYTWLEFVALHEARHARQIARIGARVATG